MQNMSVQFRPGEIWVDLKEDEAKTEEETRKDKLKKNIEEENNKLGGFENDIEKLGKEADELAIKAEKKYKLEFLAESNRKRQRVKELMIEADATKAKIRRLNESHGVNHN